MAPKRKAVDAGNSECQRVTRYDRPPVRPSAGLIVCHARARLKVAIRLDRLNLWEEGKTIILIGNAEPEVMFQEPNKSIFEGGGATAQPGRT